MCVCPIAWVSEVQGVCVCPIAWVSEVQGVCVSHSLGE